MSVYGMSEVLLDLSDLAHDARVSGHTEVEIARAAGIEVPARVDVDAVVQRMAADGGVTHPDDVENIREVVDDVLALAGVRTMPATPLVT